METMHSNGIERWVKSYCPYCGVGCGLLAGVQDDAVRRIKGDPDHPSSLGDLCMKAVYLPETLKTTTDCSIHKSAPAKTVRLNALAGIRQSSIWPNAFAPSSINMDPTRWRFTRPGN